jgi:hypothetical protein
MSNYKFEGEARRLWVRFSMLLDFSVGLILLAAIWPCGQLSLLTEISNMNLPVSKGQPVGKIGNITAISEPVI